MANNNLTHIGVSGVFIIQEALVVKCNTLLACQSRLVL